MKIDRQQLGIHLPWGMVAATLTVMLSAWYLYASYLQGTWLGGSSMAGLACGIAAGAVIAFEMLLWPRKHFRRLRLIPARHWMAAHIWLGLASLPLGVLHCGFHWGGWLTSIFMLLFILTIVSGIYGLAMQHVIPKLLLNQVAAETIYSQIDFVCNQNIEDLRQAIAATCGSRRSSSPELDLEPEFESKSAVVIGAVREVGLVKGKTLQTNLIIRNPQDREILWNAFEELKPLLSVAESAKVKSTNLAGTSTWFANLRKACNSESEWIIASMKQCYDQRVQLNLQRKLHHWLYLWLPIHIGLSVAVTVLLAVHVVTAMKYWY